ncbi:MAG: hypothetical protein V8R40_03200 [Dysosmobacter sp.]
MQAQTHHRRGASAYPRIIDFAKFRERPTTVGAYLRRIRLTLSPARAARAPTSPLPLPPTRRLRGGMILCNDEERSTRRRPLALGRPLQYIIAANGTLWVRHWKPGVQRRPRGGGNAAALADALQKEGFPVFGHRRSRRGGRAHFDITGIIEHRLDEVQITANKHAIPNDPEKPFVTSGIRWNACAHRGFRAGDGVKHRPLMARDFDAGRNRCRVNARASSSPLCNPFDFYK